jgi:hypothetical protein
MQFGRLLADTNQFWRRHSGYPDDTDWVSYVSTLGRGESELMHNYRTPQQVELDDAAPGPTYNGTFEVVASGNAAPVQITSEDTASTLSWTGTAGASVSVTFQGTFPLLALK